MPKMKTNRSASKRFRFTASGKICRAQAFTNHILTKKSMNRKRSLRHNQLVAQCDQSEVLKLLPYGR